MKNTYTTIDQKVPWCLHCGKNKMALVTKYNEDDNGLKIWVGDRTVEANTMDIQDDEIVEHVWCSGCGLLYHPNSIW